MITVTKVAPYITFVLSLGYTLQHCVAASANTKSASLLGALWSENAVPAHTSVRSSPRYTLSPLSACQTTMVTTLITATQRTPTSAPRPLPHHNPRLYFFLDIVFRLTTCVSYKVFFWSLASMAWSTMSPLHLLSPVSQRVCSLRIPPPFYPV